MNKYSTTGSGCVRVKLTTIIRSRSRYVSGNIYATAHQDQSALCLHYSDNALLYTYSIHYRVNPSGNMISGQMSEIHISDTNHCEK